MPQHSPITVSVTNQSSVKTPIKAHQIGTAYLVEHKRCNPLSALDPFCIDVKEQRYHQGEGRDRGQIISTGELSGLQVSLGQGN